MLVVKLFVLQLHVCPFSSQVLFIRKSLRKKHPELKNVTVERVNNVQGKNFVVLSKNNAFLKTMIAIKSKLLNSVL